MIMEEFDLVDPVATTPSRKRTVNFSQQEKLTLMELISNKYSNILENKKTDKVSLGEKTRAWMNIEREFNAVSPSGVFRDCEALKRLYDNRKREIRRIISREKQLRLKTGGGPDTKSELDTADQILLGIMNEKTVHGLVNPVDCDSDTTKLSSCIAGKENEFILVNVNTNFQGTFTSLSGNSDNVYAGESSQVEKFIEETPAEAKVQEEIDAQSTTQIVNSEKDYPMWKKGSDLKRKINPALQFEFENKASKVTHRRKGNNKPSARQSVKILTSTDIAKKYNQLLDSRQALVDKQIEQIDQELTFQRTKHKLEIELLSLELMKKKKETEI